MRILFAHNSYQQHGGEGIVLSAEIKLLTAMQHDVRLFSVSNRTMNDFPDRLTTALLCHYSVRSKELFHNEINFFHPDVVHVHNFFPLLTPSIYDACREANVPVVQTLHNYRTICPGALLMRDGCICEKCVIGSPYWAVFHRCYRNSFLGSFAVARMVDYHQKNKTWQNKVNRFIALTDFGEKKFIQAGFPQKKIAVKPNFIKDPLKSKKKCRQRKKSALFVGRLSLEKGVETLIDAWKKIDYHLEIAGTSSLLQKLKKNSPDNVTFLGHLSKEKIINRMAESSFLIMPSIWYEGFPMVIVESFACGLPVVASRLGSMEEIIQDGITGIHFNPGNSDDLSEKIRELISSPERIKQMSVNVRNEYEKKYTPEKNYEMLMEIYNSVIEKHKKNKFAK